MTIQSSPTLYMPIYFADVIPLMHKVAKMIT